VQRSTRNTQRVDYFEENSDSGEEEDKSNRISSRGRLIRTRSFID